MTGDNVEVEIHEESPNVIVSILERQNEFDRPQVANISQVYLVASLKNPNPDFILLDKMLVNILQKKAKVTLIFNKVDLGNESEIENIKKYYQNAKIEILFVSTYFNTNIELLQKKCENEVTLLVGQSGVGKTSLLNLLLNKTEPTGEVSRKTKRGKHTTRHAELFLVERNGYIVDTPGFSNLDLGKEIHSSKIKNYYLDFTFYSPSCYFGNCMHLNEPDCFVKKAVEEAKISEKRYQNYKYIYKEKNEKERN